jgi:hypothetical protein
VERVGRHLSAQRRITFDSALNLATSVADEVRAGTLAWARIDGAVLERETGWVYPQSSHLSGALQELIRTLETIRPRLLLAPNATSSKPLG